MKIVDNRKKENVKCFDELKMGDTFRRTNSEEVYIKTNNIDEIEEDLWGYFNYRTVANAVSLNTGKTTKLYSSDKVIPLKCECVILDS